MIGKLIVLNLDTHLSLIREQITKSNITKKESTEIVLPTKKLRFLISMRVEVRVLSIYRSVL